MINTDDDGCQGDHVTRLVSALRAEGEIDDVRAGCVVLRAYPWTDTSYLVDVLVSDCEPAPLPRGWKRGMFAGRAAEDAIRRARRAARD